MPRKTAGKALRSALQARYELEPHELVILDSAAATADLIADLQGVVDRDGVVVDGRPNPALVEVRQQRIVLGRLLAALHIPTADDGRSRKQPRGPRGFYGKIEAS